MKLFFLFCFYFRKREAEKKKKNSFGNAVYSIRFDEESEDPPSCFGAKYHFQLEEQVDVAEFLVNFDVLEYICKMEGLKCKHKVVFKIRFPKFHFHIAAPGLRY